MFWIKTVDTAEHGEIQHSVFQFEQAKQLF